MSCIGTEKTGEGYGKVNKETGEGYGKVNTVYVGFGHVSHVHSAHLFTHLHLRELLYPWRPSCCCRPTIYPHVLEGMPGETRGVRLAACRVRTRDERGKGEGRGVG